MKYMLQEILLKHGIRKMEFVLVFPQQVNPTKNGFCTENLPNGFVDVKRN